MSRKSRLGEAEGIGAAGRLLRRYQTEILLVIATFASSALVYLPFLNHMDIIYRYWDGPSYLTIARNGYAPGNPLSPGPGVPVYVAHLPLNPILIRLLSFLGWQRALLAASLLATTAAVLIFYRLARDVWRVPSAGFLSLAFLLLPPRWLLYHSVGASEPLFLAMVLASVALLEKGRIGLSCLLAGLAAATRVNGIMILPAWGLLLLARERRRSLLWLLLIPAPLFLYMFYCRARFGDFFALFEPNLQKIYSLVPLSSIRWLSSINEIGHAEFVVLLAFVYAVGIVRLRRYPIAMAYAGFQLLFFLIISSEDLSRYFLSMAPFALILGYHDVLSEKLTRWLLAAYLPFALVYSWNVIPKNLCSADRYMRLLQYLRL